METRSDEAAQAAIGAAARELRLPTIRAEATRLAEIATREYQSYLVFLAELLAAEVDDRAERRRVRASLRRNSLVLNVFQSLTLMSFLPFRPPK